MIQARIRKSLPGFTLDVEFSSAARTTVLFGSSGAGKTLTLDSIAGLVRPDEGRITIGESIVFDSQSGLSQTPQQRRCGYVFQNYALFPHMTLRENLAFAAERLARLERARRVGDMIERFGLGQSADRRPAGVSGGEQQRCSIARALIGTPRVLLLDEPARGLDAPLRASLYETLRQVSADFGTPILLVTHDLSECLELGDAMLVLQAGRLAQSGIPHQVVDRPASIEVARLFGLYNLIPAEICALDPARNTSRVRVGGIEVTGPYFERHLRGDHVTLAVSPDELRVLPAIEAPPNTLRLPLVRAVPQAGRMRLEFSGGIAVDVPLSDYDPHEHEWAIEFPDRTLRAI